MTETMKAAQFSPGGPELLGIGTVPIPTLREKEILIKVYATAINRADTLQRKGLYPPPSGESDILGLEASGTVHELGPGCQSSWKVGDRVMTLLSGGGNGEYVACREELLMPVPDGLNFVEAAAIPEVWLTAYQLLHFVGKVQNNDTVLVHAGASGVGTAATQLCGLVNAKVIVTAGSEEKIKLAKSLGASHGINYKEEDFSSKVQEYTEGGGSVNGDILSKLLRKRASIMGTTLRARPITYKDSLVQAFIKDVLPHFKTKRLKPIIDTVLPLDEIRKAHEIMESNKNAGKIVLKAEIIVWNFEERKQHARLVLHSAKIQDLAFSPNEKYLVSLSGEEEGSIVVWDLKTHQPIAGRRATEGSAIANCLVYSSLDYNVFVTGGGDTLRVWELDVANRKITPTDVMLGQIKRNVKSIQMAIKNGKPIFYCGTTTGDIMVIDITDKVLQYIGPKENTFQLGVVTLSSYGSEEVLVGSGSGELALMQYTTGGDRGSHSSSFEKKCLLFPLLQYIIIINSLFQFYVGTSKSQIFKFKSDESANVNVPEGVELLRACHTKEIKSIDVPFGTSELLVTAQSEEIRIWSIKNKRELKNQLVPRMTCNSVAITRDEKMIISAWSDGSIRLYDFDIQNKNEKSGLVEKFSHKVHSKSVSALAVMSDGKRAVSGSDDGEVHIWEVISDIDAGDNEIISFKRLGTMTGDENRVEDLKISFNDEECVSLSAKGTCIIWDLVTHKRKRTILTNTEVNAVCYGGDNDRQIITGGTNGKLQYWNIENGTLIREVLISGGSINAIDMTSTKKYVITGGEDKVLKVLDYAGGHTLFTGIGHSAPIMKVKIYEKDSSIVSVDSEGAILIWKFPLLS
ncbi:hypothetical protein FSP39_010245 [Pinctada imbricata]|uniref:Enoyl reductase (ER) domain-containing protein n=1 Tax=Pinctada imbricata TaxID=66713 RepID=A0AA88YIC6_PINIB|nr:hypothetical protein FSP39_010245 [Pinctada imbricata]